MSTAPVMHDLQPDDLVGLAQAGWDVGETLCTECSGYHRVWGVLRASGIVGGTRVDEPVLAPLFDRLVRPGARILLAGSADPGLLDLVCRSASARPIQVTVADLCPTPLRVIEALRPYPGVEVRTAQMDLTRMEDGPQWDLIVSHSMLPFVPEAARTAVVRGLKAALAPGGRLVVVARTSHAMAPGQVAAHDEAWLSRARQRIRDSGTPLPGPAQAFDAALAAFARLRRGQIWDLATPQAIAGLIADGGCEVFETLDSEESTRLDLDGRSHARRSYVFVAG
jgi:hypothetical protein